MFYSLARRRNSKINSRALCSVLAVVLASSLIQWGCAGTRPSSPMLKAKSDPDVDCSRYRSFCLYRYAETEAGAGINSITEKELLYRVRQRLLDKGYEYSEDYESDLIVTVSFANEYQEHYVPPLTIPFPTYESGQTFSFSGYAGGDYYYGSGSTSGQWGVSSYTIPGKFKGYYYPVVIVGIYDREEDQLIWLGNSVDVVSSGDFDLHSGRLIDSVMSLYPRQSGMYAGEVQAGKGWVSLRTYPDGAKVSINGVAAAFTPVDLQLPEGTHDLSFAKPGHEVWETEVTVRKGSVRSIVGTLRPFTGMLHVNSDPEPALVEINGDVFGSTPGFSTEMPVGTYTIKVIRPGFETKKYGSVTVATGKVKELAPTLTRKTSGRAMTRSAVVPGWGQAYLDRSSLGWLTLGLQAGTLGYYLYRSLEYNSLVDEYDSAVDNYNSAIDPSEVRQLSDEMVAAYEDLQDAEKQADAALMITAGVYALNLVSCWFISPDWDAGEYRLGFGISTTSRLYAGYRTRERSLGVGLAYKF